MHNQLHQWGKYLIVEKMLRWQAGLLFAGYVGIEPTSRGLESLILAIELIAYKPGPTHTFRAGLV